MKSKLTLTLTLTIIISCISFAQQGINYKAVVKDANGTLIVSASVDLEFKIYVHSPGGSSIYEEEHTAITDLNGIIIVNIGEGTTTKGDYSNIDWGIGAYFLNTQINAGEGLVDMGTTQFKMVPFALHAINAENVFSGDYTDLTNIPTTPTYLLYEYYPELGGSVIEISNNGEHGLVVAMQDQAHGISTWFDATDFVTDAANYETIGAEFKDWRLPTKREFSLIIDFEANSPIILDMNGDFYWTASVSNNDEPWLYNYNSNFYLVTDKADSFQAYGVNTRVIRAF